MLSAEMYRRQIAPHDERVLRELGGGGVHACGNIGHLVDEFVALPSIQSLDFGQSKMNDLDRIYTCEVEKRVALTRVAVSDHDLDSGKAAERFPTGVVFVRRQSTRDEDDLESPARPVE